MADPLADEKRVSVGPWEYFPAQNYEGFAIAPKGRLPTLAAVQTNGSITVFNYPGATEAHARLIAAAPELLEALKLLYREMELSGNARSKDYGWLPAITKSREAIAKAEGASRDQ